MKITIETNDVGVWLGMLSEKEQNIAQKLFDDGFHITVKEVGNYFKLILPEYDDIEAIIDMCESKFKNDTFNCFLVEVYVSIKKLAEAYGLNLEE